MKIKGYVLYDGPSVLDGQPIVCLATLQTSNPKTGPMVQTWILRADMPPTVAGKTGADASVCGNCPQRHYHGGACYVQHFQGPYAVWKSWKAGNYRQNWHYATFRNLMVRLGAYGDPAAVPWDVWDKALHGAAGWTGYTHQARHKAFDTRMLDFVMVSVDTPAQFAQAHAKAQRTFRIKAPDQPLLPGEIYCPAAGDGVTTCASCGICSGSRKLGPSVAIDAHGALAGRFIRNQGGARIPAVEVA